MNEIKVIRLGDENYPKALLDLKDPPKQLYVKGNLGLLNRPLVSIVGTRDCTRYGLMVAKDLAEHCAAAGWGVVSGLAEGIDAAAHQGAKESTIAVLGNGIEVYYPAINRDLQDEIAMNGLLISEYPPKLHADNTTFPQRNRIVAALGRAVVAVEADLRSGTLITIRKAQELNRDVYAVPGNVNCYASQGTNNLIANHGACMITSAESFVKDLTGRNVKTKSVNTNKQITLEQQSILNILKTDEMHFDEIVLESGLSVPQLSTLLTNMEMIGLIEKLPGNYYIAK
ncbi:MAG: DNA-processing protein DprA [Clostridia bacterium]|nr:DNA-processing protein DprA [Clostridia bacterium]